MHESNLARPLSDLAELTEQRLPVILTPVETRLVRNPARERTLSDKVTDALLARGRTAATRRKHLRQIQLDSGIYRPYRSF
jgi:hypothetical protein